MSPATDTENQGLPSTGSFRLASRADTGIPLLASCGLRGGIRTLAALFIATGCAGLLAEQVYEKLLTSLLGASTPAAAVVLAVYFLGLTLGNAGYSKVRRRLGSPLRTYALLEGGIALWSLVLLLGYPPSVGLVSPLLALGMRKLWLLQFLRFLVASFWILPPTLLMGATFPAIVDALESLRIPQPKRAMSRFYTLNLLGAICGSLIGPYWAFPELGLGGALGLTAGVDWIAAALAWGLCRGLRTRPRPITVAATGPASTPSLSGFKVLLGVGCLSGFLFFGLEVVWSHLIGAVLGNSVYSFAAMLALVLTGLAIGGGLSTLLFSERRPVSAASPGLLLLGASLLLAWQCRLWPGAPGLFVKWGANLTDFADGELLRWIQAGRLLLPPAVLMGMVYPCLFRIREFPGMNRAEPTARLGACNSVGCVLGALTTGFVLIPRVGSERSLVLLGVLGLISGLLLVCFYLRGARRLLLVGLAGLVGIAWLVRSPWDRLTLTSGENVYFRPTIVSSAARLLFFHEDTLGGITTVVQSANEPKLRERLGLPEFRRTLLTNGKFQANDAREVRAQTGFVLVPALYCRNFDDALVIGLGSGHSAETVWRFGFKRLDIAEIAPGIVQAAKQYFGHINGGVLDRPNVELTLDDGRNHLLLSPRRYDLITMEISSVWFAGSTSLYSRQFYDLAARRLKPGGILQQWIQLHHIGREELGSVIATMRERFAFVSFWAYGGQGILVASQEPQHIQTPALQRAVTAGHFHKGDESQAREAFSLLLSSRLLAPEDTSRMLSRVPFLLNTDFNRYLEFATPRYNLSQQPHELVNARFFARFATFPGYENEDLPEPYRSWSAALTPDHYRRALRLDDPKGDPSGGVN